MGLPAQPAPRDHGRLPAGQAYLVNSGKEGPYDGPPDDNPELVIICPACLEPIEKGQYFTRVPIGCGGDSEARRRAKMGLPHELACIVIHWADVSGDESQGNLIIVPT